MIPFTLCMANGRILEMSGFGTSDRRRSEVMFVEIPVRNVVPALKSFPIKNTGNLFWESLSYGFVEPARSTFMPVKVKLPSLGIQTPFPDLRHFAMYWPSAPQILSELPSSLSLLPPLAVSIGSYWDFAAAAWLLFDKMSSLFAWLSVSALYLKRSRYKEIQLTKMVE